MCCQLHRQHAAVGTLRRGGSKASVSMISLLEALGFIVHPMKSVTMPSQKMEFLGIMVDTTSVEVCLPEQNCRRFVQRPDL